MVEEWTAAAVDPARGEDPPSPGEWQVVDVPGRPRAFAGADAVAYRTRFPDPRDGQPRAVLELRGLYAAATVWINGERVHEHDRYFVPARVPFVPEPENEVVVECRAPRDRFGGIETTDATPPEASVPSIRWSADVRPVPAAFVADLRARGRAGDDPTIEVTATVDAAEAIDDRLTLSLRPEGFRGGGAMERVRVDADAGGRLTIERELRVREQRRWWPRDLGAQHRYAVRAKLGDHERTATTGLVTVERDDGDLLVNGRRYRARGATIPPGVDPGRAVERALEANATLLRARAHVPPPELHEACDDAGVLVWQDLPLSGSGGFDADRGRELATALEAEYGGHPSVACYGVHDAPASFDGSLGSGRTARWRLRWRAWRTGYDREDADAVAAALPGDRASYPVVGPPGTDPDAIQLHPGWHYCEPTDAGWLLDRYAPSGEFVGAFGAGSLTEATDDRVPGLDRTAHDDRVGTDDPAASQAYHARTAKAVAEALRRRGVGVAIVDALIDAAAGGGPGLLGADGAEKPAFGSVADAFEPVQAVLDEPLAPGVVGITVVNDTAEAVETELSWRAGDRQGSADVAVDGFGRADAGAAKIPDGAEAVELELPLADRTVTNAYRLPGDSSAAPDRD